MKLPIIGTGIGSGGVVSARRAVNCYFEQRPGGEKAAFIARALPKIVSRAPLTRGKSIAYLDDGYMYVDDSGTLKRWSPGQSAFIPSVVGTMSTATEWVRLAAGHDGTVITGLNGTSYAYITNSGTITNKSIVGESFVAAVYHRGWYLYASITGKLWWSDVSDDVDGLNFASADSSRDRIIELIDVGPAVAVFGERSIEFWASTGSADAVFSPIQEATQKIGVGNANQVKQLGGATYFWGFPEGGTPGLYALEGMKPTRISSEDFERDLGLGIAADWFDAQVDGFSMRGHTFIHCSHRQTGKAAMLDVSTGVWTSIGAGDPFSGQCRFDSGAGVVYVVSSAGLGEIDPQSVDPLVRRSITTDHITDEAFERITMGSVRIDCGGMPAISLRVSRDAGETWGQTMTHPVANASVKQVRFNRLGTAREFTFEISATGGFDIANVITDVVN